MSKFWDTCHWNLWVKGSSLPGVPLLHPCSQVRGQVRKRHCSGLIKGPDSQFEGGEEPKVNGPDARGRNFSGMNKEKDAQPWAPESDRVLPCQQPRRLPRQARFCPVHSPPACGFQCRKDLTCPEQGGAEARDDSVLAGSEWPYPDGNNQKTGQGRVNCQVYEDLKATEDQSNEPETDPTFDDSFGGRWGEDPVCTALLEPGLQPPNQAPQELGALGPPAEPLLSSGGAVSVQTPKTGREGAGGGEQNILPQGSGWHQMRSPGDSGAAEAELAECGRSGRSSGPGRGPSVCRGPLQTTRSLLESAGPRSCAFLGAGLAR
ncbi:hypothetical protein J1605_004344 [Eschrichtius robustus]|uniref:Uncharacterized protein n=1 Tax=Eschrichtius robustus TaxID=9764 RepID=A0AB34HEK9_ESCRO|nr:hypothetical protein J1605_004344 [Eschrichtius robustus]